MSARAADLLARIAGILGEPVEAFTQQPAAERERIALGTILDFLADPEAVRIARAFLDVDDARTRRAIADTVVAIAGGTNLKRALRA